ncbi:MAG: PAC2 family protein [Chloroflexi bacterium]|nr:PAC2 family protein [Chloroflexota bacterium]
MGNLGTGVLGRLREAVGSEAFGEIDPLGFFPLSGVTIANDIIQFPTSKFFSCEDQDFIFFESTHPERRVYAFLNLVLDVAEHLHVREIYTIGGMASLLPLTGGRRIFSVVNEPALKSRLASFGVETQMDYHGPPSINSFLLWVARTRNMSGASLWEEIPFYLASLEDPRATRTMLAFLSKRFGWEIELASLDRQIEYQADQLLHLRERNSDVDYLMGLLERGGSLTQDESQRLSSDVVSYLRKIGNYE